MTSVAADILARGASGGDIAAGALAFLVVLYVAIIVFALYVYSRIIKKAGYPWPWIFIMFVPIVNIVMFLIFALREWPIERELARTRAALAVETGSPYPDPTVYGYTDYPIDYSDTARYASFGALHDPSYPAAPTNPSSYGTQYPAPTQQQYPAPDQSQGYPAPYSQPGSGWQGQNGGLYGTPDDEQGTGKQNPWAPKG